MDFVHGWGTYGWGELPWGSSLYERSVSETLSVSDSASATGALGVSVSERSRGVDAVKALAAFGVNVQESATAADNVSAISAYSAVIQESANIAAATSTTFAPLCVVSESATVRDLPLGGADYNVHIEEYVITGITLTLNGSTFNIGVNENASADDAPSTNAVTQNRVSESATLSDADSARKLWELIDTGVTENWEPINTNL